MRATQSLGVAGDEPQSGRALLIGIGVVLFFLTVAISTAAFLV